MTATTKPYGVYELSGAPREQSKLVRAFETIEDAYAERDSLQVKALAAGHSLTEKRFGVRLA